MTSNMTKRAAESSPSEATSGRKRVKITPKRPKVTPSTASSRQTRSKVVSPHVEIVSKTLRPTKLTFDPILEDELKVIDDKGPWEAIIHKYVVFPNSKVPLPTIPLCRLLGMEAVRPLQMEAVDLLRDTFYQSGYISTHPGFYLSISNAAGEVADTTKYSASWDPIWTRLNEDFDRECDAVEDFQFLKGKMFWVFDGNHRLMAWSKVAAEYPEKLQYHPRVRFTLLNPDQMSFPKVEQAMHRLNS